MLSINPSAPFFCLPRLLNTEQDFTTPYAWRLFWGRACVGRLKADWKRPAKLTRQLRRQLERTGRLVLNEDTRRSLRFGHR